MWDTTIEDPKQTFHVEAVVATMDAMASELQERTTGLCEVTSMFGFLSPHCFRVVDDDSTIKQA